MQLESDSEVTDTDDTSTSQNTTPDIKENVNDNTINSLSSFHTTTGLNSISRETSKLLERVYNFF